MFQPVYEKYQDSLAHFPVKYVSHSILGRPDEGREVHFEVSKEASGGQEASISTCRHEGQPSLGLEAKYRTTIKDTLVELKSTNRTLSVFADLGSTVLAQRKEGRTAVRSSIIQSFLGVEFDKKTPHSKFLSTMGVFVHEGRRKFGVLLRNNHGICDELPRGKTTEIKVSQDCPLTGATIDLTARYGEKRCETGESEQGSCPYNNWSVANPFNVQLPQLSFLASRQFRDVLLQVGANREAGKGCPFIVNDGHLSMTYTPRKSHWTLVSRIGMDFSNESPVPSARVGAKYQCCERFRIIGNIDSDGKLGFGVKSKDVSRGVSVNLKGLLDLQSIRKNGLSLSNSTSGCGISLNVGLDL